MDHRYSSSNNISFSSTLLEQICQSIDHTPQEVPINSMRKKRSDNIHLFNTEEQMANYQRACMIEKWMEKKVTEKTVVRGKSMADLKEVDGRQGWSCSSSDSSFLSSSESEKPKAVRTGGEPDHRSGGGLLKTKKSSSSILKKVIKQPISPGGKVAAFFNSLFSANKIKAGDSKSSTCSSSASRSCLNKTKSSSSSLKLSVRFSPADEDENDVDFIKSQEEEELMIMEENHRKDEDEDDFDGESSCGSSDLFELDNLSSIGLMEELPLYQTTDIHQIHSMQML